MPPLHHFTTKAKDVIKKAHELAIERGQNHVNPLHLLTALVVQEDGIVLAILDKLEVDTILLADNLIEEIETDGTPSNTMSTSYQLYLTPELAQVIEASGRVSASLKDEFVSVEHLLLALFDVASSARELLFKFKLEKAMVIDALEALKSNKGASADIVPKKMKAIIKFTCNKVNEK